MPEDKKITEVIKEFFKDKKEDLFFVQVGASDGITDDYLYPVIKEDMRWRGLFIEPVAHMRQELKENHRGDTRFLYDDSAVSVTESTRNFYQIKRNFQIIQELPEWVGRVGSLSRKHFLRLIGKGNKKYTRVNLLPVTNLKSLFEGYNAHFKNVDLLCIDTEGEDYNVLRGINFKRSVPDMIIYAHTHLHKKKQKAIDLLTKFGYKIKEYDVDTVAIKK